MLQPMSSAKKYHDNLPSLGKDFCFERNSYPKAKLKLPPISPSKVNIVYTDPRRTRQSDLKTTDYCSNLPLLHQEKLQLQRERIKNTTPLSLPPLYPVLPPIGVKTLPRITTDQRERQHISPTNRDATEQKTLEALPHRTDDGVSWTKYVEINDTGQGLDEEISIELSEEHFEHTLQIPRIDVEEQDDTNEFQKRASNIPSKYQCYGDVYPPSPLPPDRKAKQLAERKRQEIRAENKFRFAYLRNHGSRRRNATCPELDIVLIQAPVLLREVFLRKTMEELCMLW